ncbi:phage tail assembly chaperone [Cereibacter azotoformans]|uniref:Phage tail assembly chaperone n=2 Tax=Cereibacter TaxID=1653176 RepID=A4WRH1_CERS5|nr:MULTISPECIES: rcc01693 family protein [Cereibacter]AXQ93236.1 phage tail assembly chaperone [Cereibacter sphaeroides]MBO4169104.1 phage tail assembly chaperone [Cereibacter azotoformans]PTR19039.1 putative phage protein (TIGR02216 family) [Cereibacter azotoformans]UIJ31551.1 phage tail assembly chaperone [Cereibacter azotoformans]ULB09336.1 phage tail assembly chaperone [Cereibacter azotoformans]
MAGLDWAGLLRVGLEGLRLSPDAFWRLTPAELRIMLGASAVSPLSRARLDELLRAYPDMRKDEDDG